jgi:4-hydroxy-tetrahydrodipicolinate synthase
LKFEGICTPAITPLRQDGEIDREGFAVVLGSLIDAKVHGIGDQFDPPSGSLCG